MSEQGTFNSFSTNKGTSGTREFLESNSLVAKFAFLIVVIFGFIILLRVGISIVSYLYCFVCLFVSFLYSFVVFLVFIFLF